MIKTSKLKKTAIAVLAIASAACITSGTVAHAFTDKSVKTAVAPNIINNIDASVDGGLENYFDSEVVYRLPDTVAADEDISVIVTMSTDSYVDAYEKSGYSGSLQSYLDTFSAERTAVKIEREKKKLLNTLDKSGVEYTLGTGYNAVFSGFEITVKASDFERVDAVLGDSAKLIVGEVYNRAETEIVTNEVDVYETGIFNSSECDYHGDGVVVAVLDTGCDYTHTAFSTSNFTTSNKAFTLSTVNSKIAGTNAASTTSGLTGSDVYVSSKIPFAYDYADKDSDVAPINSAHGTHVAGIIAGNDDTITGVAPNAQLAIMKVFSDTREGAKQSWILAAVDDCVKLGVDVINMSLGSSCGFSREIDKESTNEIYDRVKATGISLIAAASNDYNATFGSEKNGSLGLTSNPDSGTVGSPSTYDSALSVASVDGVKTPYITHDGRIIYFKEASTSSAKNKDFVADVLKEVGDVDSYDFTYVTIPGIGRSADYLESGDYYHDKIVLVRRGTTTFEDKVRVALVEKGAAGIIIYNNVSGDISMSVGKDIGAVCSISQNEGELLAKAGTGILHISRNQVAGPFMSDFSSWGPTSDLKIKPEITAHGGEILSCVPGQNYDRLSGTSMAAPNQAGATALIRQYVKYSGVFGDLTSTEVTARVNQLMMSTADVIRNKNGLAYSVRKQGAGLMNILAATKTASYISTYDEGGEMDKSKIELGDDKEKSGVYEATFGITNVTSSAVTYDLDAIVMTEGVGETYTSHGDTTVTQDGRMLDGRKLEITAINGGTQNGMSVSVNAGSTARVTVKITLSDGDKAYLDKSFKHGMYVEGFITFKASAGTKINMNVPMLAFYGDWTEAPIFDEEYYDTHKDEINTGLDDEDKLMPDAYATRVIGGLYSDYIATLGTYYFVQDPAGTKVAASKDHIAVSNQKDGKNSCINTIRSINAGLLRNCREVNIKITEDSTGKDIFSRTEYNVRKSHSSGNTIYASGIDVEFDVLEHQLKNNTKYTVTVTAYIDYGENQTQKNVRNTFTFPMFIDFEAPVVTDVDYRTEYDRNTQKTKLFADISIYDNHYAMGMQVGQITDSKDPQYRFSLSSFGKYITPVYSNFNSTSVVTVELTDYISKIKNSKGLQYSSDGSASVVENNNSFIVMCYDYAMNSATYELRLPDDVTAMYFANGGEEIDEIKLSPNETLNISSLLNIYPEESWIEVLDFSSDNPEIADVINNSVIAKSSGSAVITATGRDRQGNAIEASLTVKVLAPGEEGYVGGYSIPEVNKFQLNSYTTLKAYYAISSEDRKIGITDGTYDFGNSYALEMYPSESVSVKYKSLTDRDENDLNYSLDSYFPENTSVEFQAGNSRVATVTPDGVITAQAEGTTIIMMSVRFNGKATLYSQRITITVKDPFTTQSIYLMSYKGLGDTVTIPSDRGITTIYSFAFSNYEYVDKDLSAGDVIDEEDPYYIKQWYIGEDTIKKVIIPEGVEEIQSYAFAKLTALEEVVLPTTLKKIGVGAFYGCEKLKKINLENVQFINKEAFFECALENVNLDSVVAIGNYTFAYNKLVSLTLPTTAQSLGEGAFRYNGELANVTFKASKIKIAPYVFADCTQLLTVKINAVVISTFAFYRCSELKNVELGKDVSVIGEYAFAGTAVAKFTLARGNTALTLKNDGVDVYSGDKLILRAPAATSASNFITTDAEYISDGAFAGNKNIIKVSAPNAKVVGAYAFADCSRLAEVDMPQLTEIGEYAFAGTKISATPDLTHVTVIGAYAFAGSDLTSVTIAPDTIVNEYAFFYCPKLTTVTIGGGAKIGDYAFCNPINWNLYENAEEDDRNTVINRYYRPYTYEIKDESGAVRETITLYRFNISYAAVSDLQTVTVGDGVTLGQYSFAGNIKLNSLTFGEQVNIGDYAFVNARALTSVNLSKVKTIGNYAFTGSETYDYMAYSYNGSVAFRQAYFFKYVDDQLTADSYATTTYAPAFVQADLSSATSIGTRAFAFNSALTSVTFGAVDAIPDYAFARCSSLAEINLPESVKTIGDYAFFDTAITQVDLSGVERIGDAAFASCDLTSVTLKENAVIDNYTFRNNELLATVTNLDKAVSIGDYAFFGSALTEVNLKNAETLGDYAFGGSKITKVTFGDKLTEVGENPFYDCKIVTYGKFEDVKFNGSAVQTVEVATYDVSSSVKVIDGVLYKQVKNGLTLVSYPAAREGVSYTVKEGTVRISARAFSGSKLEAVILASTLKAIGDKAFYGCEALASVAFLSYEAPTLEEEYDSSYANLSNVPISGYYSGYEGLGISKYYMWNVAGSPNNFYFGANFVDYIGHISNNLVMVKPANGVNYETFILSQYFKTTVNGGNAASAKTLEVISLIAALPDEIKLENANAVAAARNAYDNLSDDQKGLISNKTKLERAEKELAALTPEDDHPVAEKDNDNLTLVIVGFSIAGVAVIALAAFITVTLLKKKKGAPAVKEETAAEDETDNNVEDGTDNNEKEETNSEDGGNAE